jgi:hypothetical protein
VTELDRDARRILELTRRSRTPTADDKARLERRLAAALVLGTTSAHAGGAATSKVVAGTLSVKWGAIALVAVVAAAYAGLRATHGGAAPSASAAHVAAPKLPVVSATLQESSPSAGVAAEAPPSTATEAQAFVAASDGPVQDVARAAPKHAPHTTLPEELDLLHDAQAKWRAGNATAALALLAEHRRRFPHSELAPERNALTVLSLCATNRTTEARRIAQGFLKHARNSPLRSAVEESCGGNE